MSKIQNPKIGDLVDIITPDKFKVKMQIFEFDEDELTITLGIPNGKITSSKNSNAIFMKSWNKYNMGEKVILRSSNNIDLMCNLSVALKNGKLILSIDPKMDEKHLIRRVLRELGR